MARARLTEAVNEAYALSAGLDELTLLLDLDPNQNGLASLLRLLSDKAKTITLELEDYESEIQREGE